MKLETYTFGNLACAEGLVKILNAVNDEKLFNKSGSTICSFYYLMKEIKKSNLLWSLKIKYITMLKIQFLDGIDDLRILNKDNDINPDLWTHFNNVIVSIARKTMKEIKDAK